MDRRLRVFLSIVGGLVSVVYLLNPTFGVFELIPDNLPFFGNLDEAGATALLIACVRGLRQRSDGPGLLR